MTEKATPAAADNYGGFDSEEELIEAIVIDRFNKYIEAAEENNAPCPQPKTLEIIEKLYRSPMFKSLFVAFYGGFTFGANFISELDTLGDGVTASE